MVHEPRVPVGNIHSDDASCEEFSEEERAALDAVNGRIAGAQTLDDVLNFLFDTTASVSPCDRLGVAFLDPDGTSVVAHWMRAVYEPVYLGKGYAQDLHGSSLDAVLANGVPRVIDDLEAYLEAHPDSESTRLIVREGIRSSMTCPLVVEGRRVGLLFRSSRQTRAYERRHVLFHQAIAERLSQVVEKAWRIEQLAAANRAYFEMLGFVTHELKSPLASLVMDAEGLLEGMHGPLEPAQRQRVTRMMDKAQFLLTLIGDYLNLSKIESDELVAEFRECQDFEKQVVRTAVELLKSHIEVNRDTLHFLTSGTCAPVRCDIGLMTIVLVNLLSNAVKYGEEEGEIRVRVRYLKRGVRVSVWNRGPGFPPEERPRLFRRFSRLNTPELMKRKGTGVGLYTAWRIVRLHGGHMRADSKPGRWAEFTFEIPQPLPVATTQ